MGREDPQAIQPELAVLVNQQTTLVNWTRSGDVFQGRIPPRTVSGPWAIRVEVRDQHELVLGRAVLQVTSRDGSSGTQSRSGW